MGELKDSLLFETPRSAKGETMFGAVVKIVAGVVVAGVAVQRLEDTVAKNIERRFVETVEEYVKYKAGEGE